MASVSLRTALGMFPEAASVLPTVLEETKKELFGKVNHWHSLENRANTTAKNLIQNGELVQAIELYRHVDNCSLKRTIRTLQLQTYALEVFLGKRNGISPEDIERARSFPIGNLVGTTKRKSLCPFHNEKTPSFSIFKNRFRCFGCNKGGDTISFVMDKYHLDFISAVKAINEYAVL